MKPGPTYEIALYMSKLQCCAQARRKELERRSSTHTAPSCPPVQQAHCKRAKRPLLYLVNPKIWLKPRLAANSTSMNQSDTEAAVPQQAKVKVCRLQLQMRLCLLRALGDKQQRDESERRLAVSGT